MTGSTSGIGAGIARRFAQEGATVIINGRRRDAAERVAAEIRRQGGKAIIALGDLSQGEEVARVVETAQTELGGVDILMNNAASRADVRFRSAQAMLLRGRPARLGSR